MTFALHSTAARQAIDCLAKVKAASIDRLPVTFPPYLFGQAVHAAIEGVTVASARGEHDAAAAAIAALDLWQAANDAPGGVYDRALRLVEEITRPDRWLRFHIAPRGRTAAEMPWALDEEFRAVAAGEPHAYGGRFDRLDWSNEDGVTVVDYKSTLAFLREDDVAADWQARMYALAALALFPGVDEVRVEFWLLRHDYKASHVFERGAPWERVTRAWMRRTRDRLVAALETGEFPATPGEGCDDTCPVLWACIAREAALVQGDLPDLPLVERARLYLLAKKTAAGLDRDLRAALAEQAVDVGDGTVLGFKPGTRNDLAFGLYEVVWSLEEKGATREELARWFPGSSISKEALRSALTELAESGRIAESPKDALSAFYEERPTATFTTHTPPPSAALEE